MQTTSEIQTGTNDGTVRYFAPTRPFGVVAAVNRASLATGGPRRAEQGQWADYNGHHVVVGRNDHAYGGHLATEEAREARGWRAYYMWSGTQYLARATDFKSALDAAVREYARGALGASVSVTCHTPDQCRACEAAGLLPWSEEAEAAATASWCTPLHAEVHHALALEKQVGVPAVSFLIESSSVEDYRARVDAWRQRCRDAR